MSNDDRPAGPPGERERAIADAIDGLIAVVVRGGPRDISLTTASAMATLRSRGPCRLTELAEIEGVAQPSMTTLVTGLERSGLAERRPSPDDGRVVLVTLTAKGEDYLAARRRARAARLAELIQLLPSGQAAALADAVPAMVGLRDLDTGRRAAGIQAGASPRGQDRAEDTRRRAAGIQAGASPRGQDRAEDTRRRAHNPRAHNPGDPQ